MFLIAIEGIDGSGKGTQAALLRDALSQHLTVDMLSFPRYKQTFFGARIGEFLNGQYGTLEGVDPFLAATLFAGDRFESLELIEEKLQKTDVLICDRYVTSNLAHQCAKLDRNLSTLELQTKIERLEYEIYGLPSPDFEILLDIPVELAVERIALKQPRDYTQAAADLHEANRAYLERVSEVYLDYFRDEGNSVMIPVRREDTIGYTHSCVLAAVTQHAAQTAIGRFRSRMRAIVGDAEPEPS